MKYLFHIVDVFSRSAIGGNQLAVLPEASGLSPEDMQKIAREFNFAETTFVLPAERPDHTRRVRIFTPKAELPFAGHPTVGTACTLVTRGYVDADADCKLILEEGAGPVVVDVDQRHDGVRGTLTLFGKVEWHATAPRAEDLAGVLSLPPAEVTQVFFASVGLAFCFVHLTSRDAVDRAAIDKAAWMQSLAKAWSPNVFFFAGDLEDGSALYARMCAPALGMEEDPATGSACAALVGVMATRPESSGEEYRLKVQQGVAMGRRSDIDACARKSNSAVASVSVGGATTYVAGGESDVPPEFLLP
jgi:trans-2,3-dihydro-3-hydroxyanthranilate isomerase